MISLDKRLVAKGIRGGGQGFGGFDFSGFSAQGGPASGWDFGGTGFEDIFSDIFSGRGTGRGRSKAGADIQVDVEISFEEMVRGVEKEITLRKLSQCTTCRGSGGKPGSNQHTCSVCKGSGQVRRTVQSIFGTFAQASVCENCRGSGKTYAEQCPTCQGIGRREAEEKIAVAIPAGIRDTQVLSMAGQGAAGEAGSGAGDLFIVVHVRPHATLKRRGDDILSTLDITFPQAALGDKITLTTIEGPVTMKIPSGTQAGEVFRIKGKGVPHVGQFGRGDHLVSISLKIPKKLSSEEKKAIEFLRDVEQHKKN
jgi:molecular chaperone DnaJ